MNLKDLEEGTQPCTVEISPSSEAWGLASSDLLRPTLNSLASGKQAVRLTSYWETRGSSGESTWTGAPSASASTPCLDVNSSSLTSSGKRLQDSEALPDSLLSLTFSKLFRNLGPCTAFFIALSMFAYHSFNRHIESHYV